MKKELNLKLLTLAVCLSIAPLQSHAETEMDLLPAKTREALTAIIEKNSQFKLDFERYKYSLMKKVSPLENGESFTQYLLLFGGTAVEFPSVADYPVVSIESKRSWKAFAAAWGTDVALAAGAVILVGSAAALVGMTGGAGAAIAPGILSQGAVALGLLASTVGAGAEGAALVLTTAGTVVAVTTAGVGTIAGVTLGADLSVVGMMSTQVDTHGSSLVSVATTALAPGSTISQSSRASSVADGVEEKAKLGAPAEIGFAVPRNTFSLMRKDLAKRLGLLEIDPFQTVN